ncbi:flagellar protein FlbD [Ornithinibacillus sp. L9]|uniref:Flagellar protein FlbD n=1 Tax=Ornithinibacillus caprae TaxID=2678566 RepID=A0A6N8FQM5_9BACI|nr:flagellar FlbD family protein [Ornithinibacillus caprae]MUK89908.1 flagellar protein FlbD [Ornithinibacillus caprae]
MIPVTRLNGEAFVLNGVMIEQVQALPDTTITLQNGKKIVVREPVQEVVDLITTYYQKVGIQQSLKEVSEASE